MQNQGGEASYLLLSSWEVLVADPTAAWCAMAARRRMVCMLRAFLVKSKVGPNTLASATAFAW